MLVELRGRLVETHRFPDCDRVELGEDDSQLLDCAQSAGAAAVADEADWFGVPFGSHRVDRGLQGSGVAVVVFGSDDDEGIGGADPGGEVRTRDGVSTRSITSTLTPLRCLT